MQNYDIDQYSQTLIRECKECQQKYTIEYFIESSNFYFPRPYNYRKGCETYCLGCWLGVESHISLDMNNNGFEDINESSEIVEEIFTSNDCYLTSVNHNNNDWPYEEVYESLMKGELLPTFQWFLENGSNLAVMPIGRVHVERIVVFPGPIIFYPPGWLDLDELNIVPNQTNTTSSAELASAASGITRAVLNQHSLVVFPCKFDWQAFRKSNHESHLEFIRWMSEEIDRCCLNFVRYQSCRLEPIDDLPARAGQVDTNHMMAGTLLYSGVDQEARIIGGAAFTHYLTRGLGLPIDQLEWDSFPRNGEVGKIANQALLLYTSLLESSHPTARFIQALSLLEFLADPDQFINFKDVKKIIARYCTSTRDEYQRILDRLLDLTGKRENNRHIGFRTRVVHIGDRIETIIPNPNARKQLFLELDGYIRPVLDHMIMHSDKSWEEYLEIRKTLGPNFK